VRARQPRNSLCLSVKGRSIAGSIPTLCGALAVGPETSVSNSVVGQ
jgi:hypothetical protein